MSLREDAKMVEINRIAADLNKGEDYWRMEIPVIREDSFMAYWPAVVKNGGHPFNVKWDAELRIWKVTEDTVDRMEITSVLANTETLTGTMESLMQYVKETYSDRSQQVYELVEQLNRIDEADLMQQEKEFIRDIWAAERKLQAAQIQRILTTLGLDVKVQNTGANMQIKCGYIMANAPRYTKQYSKEEEENILGIIRRAGWECEAGPGTPRGGHKSRLIRIKYKQGDGYGGR